MSSLNQKNKLKVFMLPFSDENPYQTKLCRSLKPFNTDVKGTNKIFFIWDLLNCKPDVVHFHWLHVYFLGRTKMRGIGRLAFFILQLVIVKMFRISIVWTAHNLVNHEKQSLKLDHMVTQLVAWLSARIITHSHSAKLQLLDYLPSVNRDKVTVIEHGNFIDDYPLNISKQAARDELGVQQNDFVVMFLGQIREYKGVGDLIQAFSSLPKKENFTLLLAGKPNSEELKKALNAIIADGNNIKFVAEFIPNEKVATFFAASDVSVLPYKSILTSGALVLAMGFGNSVIIPQIESLKETAHANATVTYKTNNIDSLAKALQRAYEGRQDLIARGVLNAQKAAACTWEIVGEKTNSVYRRV